jgi:hypothetical protein
MRQQYGSLLPVKKYVFKCYKFSTIQSVVPPGVDIIAGGERLDVVAIKARAFGEMGSQSADRIWGHK